MSVSVAIGSWADSEYVGILYPKGMPASKRLATYARHFSRVEVNSSYYATPRPTVTSGWAKQTPPDFIFDIKLHRAFSQSPEKTARESELLNYLLKGVRPLVQSDKLGVFLLVAAPTFSPERNRLEQLDTLIEKLAPHRLAVELRHVDWVMGRRRKETFDYFRAHKLVWVSVDMPRVKAASILPPLDEVTNPELAYVRLHGRNRQWLKAKSAADRHCYEYSARELRGIVQRVRKLEKIAAHVHVVANNHARDFAPKAALQLQRMLAAPQD